MSEQADTSRTSEEQDQPQDATMGKSTEAGQEENVAERGGDSPEASAQKSDFERETQEAKDELERLEEDPPERLEDWPTGKAKYETFGGPEGEHGYHEGPERKLGPDSLRHTEEGGVEVEGEQVENPEEFKGEPIPGGPTDPDTPDLRMDDDASGRGD